MLLCMVLFFTTAIRLAHGIISGKLDIETLEPVDYTEEEYWRMGGY